MAIDPSPSMSFSKSDDLALMHGVLHRRQEALAELYDRFAALLLAVARRVLSASAEAAEAEEVLQETFFQVWNQTERFDSGASSVSAWLVSMARDRALARLRRRPLEERGNPAKRVERDAETLPGVHVESRAVAERRQRVQQALTALSIEDKQVLELAFFDGLSLSEIAERTRTPFPTVRARALQAMKALRQDLRTEIRELM